METLITKLRSFSRYLELEGSIPHWKSRKLELQLRIAEMNGSLQQKEQELLSLKSSGFFRRILGKDEAKKEKLSSQIQQIIAARTGVQWELEDLDLKIADGTQEREGLAGCRSG